MSEYMVIISHNFDTETRAIHLASEAVAQDYLRWIWEVYYNEEIANESRLVESACWCECDNALVTWEDGCFTKFEIVVAYAPETEFFEHHRNDAKDERIILSISPEEIDNAIELMELGGFYNNHPEAKAEALNCADQRLSKYIDNNVFISDLIMEAVEDTASAYGFI